MRDAIVVGYDRTEASWVAVRWAAAEAAVRARTLRVVTCDDRFDVSPAEETWGMAVATTSAYAEVRSELDEACSQLRTRHPDLDVEAFLLGASCTDALCDERLSSELVVVGSSSHRGAAAMWRGSTPRIVARHSHRPVVIVRGAPDPIERIVVGVDASTRAGEVLEWAIDEANLHQVSIDLVHVWEYPYATAGVVDCPGRAAMHLDAARLLRSAAQHACDRGVRHVEQHLLEGSPSRCLAAAVRPGDLLVLGSHGSGTTRSGVLGSTVNSLLDDVAVPVVVLPVGSAAG